MNYVDAKLSVYHRVFFAFLTLILIVFVVLAQRADRSTAQELPTKADKRKERGKQFQLPAVQANEIVTENALAGSPASEWDVSGSGDASIQGFATDISVDQGQTVHFKIDSPAAYEIKIYRLGYYGGLGARHVATIGDSATAEADQPACTFDSAGDVNLTDCGNWSVSASWSVPSDAVSGIYIAKPTRLDNDGASHIAFIVRDDDGASDVLFQTSDTTWQAYNKYGGYSLYGGPGSLDGGHARKVSYNRPFTVRGDVVEDWLFNAEYPMLRWLERNGYDVSYTTDIDSDRFGTEILEHKIFMSVGHDEYWSAAQRANVEAARDAGVNLAFFSGNEIYWKTRWESSAVDSTSFRTLVSYKEGDSQGTAEHWNCHGNFDCDPHPTEWTGLWRQNQTGHDAGRPENSLSGQISWGDATTAMQISASDSASRFWRNTGVSGATTLAASTLGYEFDWEQPEFAGHNPPGRITVSDTTATGKNHKMSLYRAPSGALVFGAGTVQWMWGLDGVHDRGSSTEDPRMQQATVNILSDMGVQPETLQSGLVPGGPLDTTLPTTVITSPANGASAPGGSVTVTGTSVDTVGNVAMVEVSTDGGSTWKKADGTSSWSFTFGAPVGPLTILARAVDDAANIGPASQVSITLACPCSIWSLAAGGGTTYTDGPVELGTKFRSSTNGYVTALRYWNPAGASGTRVGHLWTSSGTQIAEVTFPTATGTGWQEAQLSSPVAVSANTTYIVSYHAPNGYSSSNGYFAASGVNAAPLRALQNGEDGTNGVYKYGPSGTFPDESYQSSNYWVDVVFVEDAGPDTTAPLISAKSPSDGASGVAISSNITATFNEPMNASTIGSAEFELRKQSDSSLIASSITFNSGTRVATLDPASDLEYSTAYTVRVAGGSSGVKDTAGNPLASDAVWTFTTMVEPPPPPDEGPGGPILVVSAASNPFSRYYAEILRAEGLNAFVVKDIATVNAGVLAAFDVVILGDIPVSPAQAAIFGDWVNDGGNLIAMSPDDDLSSLLGLVPTGNTLSEGYLLVNTSTPAGSGIVGETIQFHGSADVYTVSTASSIADLYSNANTATMNPAVTIRSIGPNGGQAAAFAYDLARSVVYTRQGNPAWSGQERDGESGPIRSNDLFFPDWVNLDKVSIPQADEQQRLLANLIGHMNFDKKPLPRFWFLPDRHKAAVVMTGDDHGTGGSDNAFDYFIAQSPSGCSVDDWECIRGTSYVFPGTTIDNQTPAQYQSLGFEIGLHVNTGCGNYASMPALNDLFTDQLANFSYAGIAPPATNRTHCIAWSDWASTPKVSFVHGIRLDTNYYYWPGSWVQDRPGMFTGSGSPMRFADIDGSMIDVYQAATQITDESGQNYTAHIGSLLDNAIGAPGYYGVFTVNMHTDISNYPSAAAPHPGAVAIIDAAKARGVPVVSAKQMLTWIDGRNNSSFDLTSWSGGVLGFSINAAPGSRNLNAMVPVVSIAGTLTSILKGTDPVSFSVETIKGVQYAFFPSTSGSYTATYTSDTTPPIVTANSPADGSSDVDVSTVVTATFSEAMNGSTIDGSTVELLDGANATVPSTVVYNAGTMTVTLTPSSPLNSSASYTVRVRSGAAGVKDLAGNPLANDHTWSFSTISTSVTTVSTIWPDTTIPANPSWNDNGPVEVGLYFQSSQDGYITGVRFYKGVGNTGTHIGRLWNSAGGSPLAEATFMNETATGWQTVMFDQPVAITANTTYVASYYAPNGNYAVDLNGLASDVISSPLTATGGGYNYSANWFPSNVSDHNFWVDVVFDTNPGDTTAPQIASRYPVVADYGVPLSANVRVTFNEEMNSATINGSSIRLRKDGSGTDVPAVVSFSGATATLDPAVPLDLNAIYHVTVAGSVADVSNNQMGPDATWSFITAPAEFTDWSFEHFAAGSVEDTYVSLTGDGEVILAPEIADEFNQTALGSQWVTHLWSGGGSAQVASGQLASNGSRIGTVGTYTPGRSMEFVATFGPATFQHVGFGIDYNDPPWAMFSTFNSGSQLFARTHDGSAFVDTPIPGSLLGSPHRYRIDWLPGSVAYYVDGTLVATHNISPTVELRPLISDFNDGAPGLSVDWLRMGEMATSGYFYSRIHDAGVNEIDWMQMVYNAELPNGTAVTFETRTGNSAVPDLMWSSWSPVNGALIASPDGRYMQYRATLTSASNTATPELRDVTLSYMSLRASAANVSLSGRVMMSNGRGISGVIVKTVDSEGAVRQARSNSFGYYKIEGIPAGTTVVLSAASRAYSFEPRVLMMSDDLANTDLIALRD